MVRPVAPPVASPVGPAQASGVSGSGPSPRFDAAGPSVRRALSDISLRSWRPPRALLVGAALVAVLVVAGVALLGTGAVGSSTTGLDEQLPLSRASIGTALAGATVPVVGREPMAAPAPAPSQSTSSTSSTVVASGLVVHAAGALVAPGVYVMEQGTRLADLVVAAGGLAPDADPDVINLAAPLRDGQRVFVPHRGRPVPSVVVGIVDGMPSGATAPGVATSAGAGADGSSAATALVDLNRATAEQLDALPGVGPATAAAIIEHRTRVGPFRSVTQLLDVPGIGEAKLAALRRRVSVTPG